MSAPINLGRLEELELTPGELDSLRELQEAYQSRDIQLTEDQLSFINDQFSSKWWRLNNLYTIRDKDGNKLIMKLNNAQEMTLRKFKHNRKIILKTRQQGISTLFLAYYLDDCITKPGFQAGIQSYGIDEAEKLSARAKLMWEELDSSIKSMLGIDLVSCNSKGMTFSNGSVLRIGNFRGDTLQGLHVSELGKIAKKYPEKAKELKTGAFQAVGKNNKITVESTAEGKTGLFYEMWNKAVLKEISGTQLSPFDFQAIFLSWVIDPDCNLYDPIDIPQELKEYFTEIEKKLSIVLSDSQKWWYVSKLEEMGEDMKQEYPTFPEEAFEQSLEGTYYKHEYEKLNVQVGAYDENLLVHQAFDLGMKDTFVMGFFQVTPGGRIKLIADYGNSYQGLDHYRDVCAALAKDRGWEYGQVYVPHDIAVKELIAGKTRWDAVIELGWDPVLVKKHSIDDGIEATRQMLKNIIVDEQCEDTRLAIQNYRKKFDRRLDLFLDIPEHDKHSHYADMLRAIAMGMKYSPITKVYRYYTDTRYRDYGATRKGYDV